MGEKTSQLSIKLRCFALYGSFLGVLFGLLIVFFIRVLLLIPGFNSSPYGILLGVFYIYQFGSFGFILGINTGAYLNRRNQVYKKLQALK